MRIDPDLADYQEAADAWDLLPAGRWNVTMKTVELAGEDENTLRVGFNNPSGSVWANQQFPYSGCKPGVKAGMFKLLEGLDGGTDLLHFTKEHVANPAKLVEDLAVFIGNEYPIIVTVRPNPHGDDYHNVRIIATP